MRSSLLLTLLLGLLLVACRPWATGRGARDPSDEALREEAQEALLNYFQALHEGRYVEAAALYGGEFDALRDNNPMIEPEDLPALFEAACTINGFQCLEVLEVVTSAPMPPDGYRFTVEFQAPDGGLFARGACCGAESTDVPPRSQFAFTVLKEGDRFLVQELPVYVP